ncbi:unnamed protein product [Gadus morhua 'NCC']
MLLLAPSVENLWDTASTTCPLGLQGRCARDGLPQYVIEIKHLKWFGQDSNLCQSLSPGPWKETTGLNIEGFPRQKYGIDCGIFMLMYALYKVMDAPSDSTVEDMEVFLNMAADEDLRVNAMFLGRWVDTH